MGAEYLELLVYHNVGLITANNAGRWKLLVIIWCKLYLACVEIFELCALYAKQLTFELCLDILKWCPESRHIFLSPSPILFQHINIELSHLSQSSGVYFCCRAIDMITVKFVVKMLNPMFLCWYEPIIWLSVFDMAHCPPNHMMAMILFIA